MLYYIAVAIIRFLMFFVIRFKVEGVKNIPPEGGMILAVNHRSNYDPVFAAVACTRRLTFMAKAELFKNRLFGALLKNLGAFPINRGSGDIGAIKSAFSILGAGKVMLIFPEGRRIKAGMESKAQPGVAMIAHRTGAPVVPTYIEGDVKWMHKITVTFGKPITLDEYKDKKLNSEELQTVANDILKEIHSLATEK